jgi:hypothetical protein
MGQLLAHAPAGGSGQLALPRRPVAFGLPAIAFLALAFAVSGCHRLKPVDTAPLDQAGMSYDAIQQLKKLDITTPEISEIAQVRQAGLPDDDCVELLQIYRGRGQEFKAGAAVAGLAQAGLREDTIFELAKLNQLGLGWGELQAMRLAGLSDSIILEVARHHARGKPVLGGASLARMKNAGMRERTLLKLVQRGVPDTRANAILSARRRGASESQILRRFAGS